MPRSRTILILILCAVPSISVAQFGGMGGAGGQGMGAPPGPDKPRFRDHLMQRGGINARRESGDKVVAQVRIIGNRQIETERIVQLLQTRRDGFYDYQTVLADVKRLYEFRAFSRVTESVEETPEGMVVTFTVEEHSLISKVIFLGNRAMGERELRGRAGIAKGDPLNPTAVESTRRRLADYYHEEGFNQVWIDAQIGYAGNPATQQPADPQAVVFRINEGVKERIGDIRFLGNTIVSGNRLSKVIESRGPFFEVGTYIGNVANLDRINGDVKVLTNYYRNLGYLTAKVDRLIEYDETLKWVTVTFVIEEGPRYQVNKIHIMGNKFIDEVSLRTDLKLQEGAPFSQTEMSLDIEDITYTYGSLGFIYAEVTPELRFIDAEHQVDLIYKIEEGDRWKIGQIFVKIDGEPNLMRESTMLNYLDLVEGQYIDRRKLELNERRLLRSELLETNPAVAEPPELRVVPRDGEPIGGRQ